MANRKSYGGWRWAEGGSENKWEKGGGRIFLSSPRLPLSQTDETLPFRPIQTYIMNKRNNAPELEAWMQITELGSLSGENNGTTSSYRQFSLNF